MSFTTDAANSYALQRGDDLSGSWVVIATNVPGTGFIVTVTNSGAVALPKGFYRARSLP